MAGSSFLRRLIGTQDEDTEGPKLAIHMFVSMTAELARQDLAVSNALAKIAASGDQSLIAEWTLSTTEQNHWTWILNQAKLQNLDRTLYEDVLMLGEHGVYSEQDCIDRLGLPV